jgi:translation initiation factor 5B
MSNNTLRSPVCCVLGHVDVGKTKFLDAIRSSSVQEHESGGITQQIGATFFHRDYINKLMKSTNKTTELPGLLFIDTPGHDCFTNLRIRGTEIADIAIVIVDIIKGLEKQTIECIKLLNKHKTPFVVALNKLDKILDWKPDLKSQLKNGTKAISFKKAIKKQSKNVKGRVNDYINKLFVQFAENAVNVAPFYDNKNDKEYVSMVPISAHTKEGIPDLLMVMTKLTTKYMKKKLKYHDNSTKGYVMDVYKNGQYGTVLNVILIDGSLKRGQNGIFCGNDSCLDLQIKGIYEPVEGIEMKGHTNYKPKDSVTAAKGIMIKVDMPENIIPGTKFCMYETEEKKAKVLKKLTEERLKYINDITNRDFAKQGIYINSPSFGPLEALWNICQKENIPVSGMCIGDITKKELFIVGNHVYDTKDADYHNYSKQYTVILNYQNTATPDIKKMANELNVSIIDEDIIYKIIEKYQTLKENIYQSIRDRHNINPKFTASIISKYVFNRKNPIVMGVRVLSGTVKLNSFVCIQHKELILGKIESIQYNKKDLDEATANKEVCLKIVSTTEHNYEYGRDFTDKDTICNYYTQDDLRLINKLSDVFMLE